MMMKRLAMTRLLALLLALCLLPALALADTALDSTDQDPHAPTAAPGAPGEIPSQDEDPHAPADAPAEPEATGSFGPTPTASAEALGYDLEGTLAELPVGLSALERKQVEVLLRNMLNLKAEFDQALAAATRQVEAGERAAAWRTLLYYTDIFGPMFPGLEDVHFVCFDNRLERLLFRTMSDLHPVALPIELSSAYYLMGYIAIEEGEKQAAVDALALAVSYGPTQSENLYEYANALVLNGQLDEALDATERGLSCSLTREQVAKGYRALGYHAVEAGDYRYAACLYTASMEYSEDDTYAEGELDYIYQQDSAALDELEPGGENVHAELAAHGVTIGLSDEARGVLALCRAEYADSLTDEERAFLDEWAE